MSDNAIVVIKERIGDLERPTLVIIAMADVYGHARLAEMAQGIQAFRSEHPDVPPILIVGSGDGGWTTMQTDDPESARLADELREAVGIP